MRSLIKTICLLFCLALPFAASAQSENQTVNLGSSTSIVIPADWQVTENETGYFTLEGDGITNRPMTIEVMTPGYIRAMGVNFNDDRNIIDVLIALTTLLDGVEPNRADVQKTLYDNRAAASYLLRDAETTDTLNVALTLNDGSFGFVKVTVVNGLHVVLNRQVSEIIASFDTTRSAPTGDACTVRADAADAAQLRVGPGTNRGAISFLPEDTDVTATGRIELDDGSVWYQLDLNEAAPNGTAAAELWVFEDDVTLSGDCANVGDTAAPPVIRAAPQVVNPSTDTNATPVPGAAPQTNPVTAGLQQAQPGTWTITIQPVVNASCGGQNVPIQAAEILETLNYTIRISVANADSMLFDGDSFTRYPGSNSFDGYFSFEEGTASTRIDVLSPTTIHGEINMLFEIDGYTCSATVLFDSFHN